MITHSIKSKTGFSLVELLIVMAVSTVIIAAALASYITYVNSSAKESAQDTVNAEVATIFNVIGKEVMNAGYALPIITRVASNNNCTVADEDFCKSGTDRLFLADGAKLLRDVTDNKEDDGTISTTYMTYLANAKGGSTGGYRAQLAADVATGDTSATVVNLNINSGEELNVTINDFLNDTAFIIGDGTNVEGHRIDTTDTDAGSISLLTHEVFNHLYLVASNHSVVPATAWYVRSDPGGRRYSNGDTVYWLYRNGTRALPYVDNFQVQYGYDASGNGIEWADTIPPANIAADTYDDWAPTPDLVTFSIDQLKVIKVNIAVKSVYRGTVRTTDYQKIIQLRN